MFEGSYDRIPYRPGKTRHDRMNSSHERNQINKQRRVDWQKDTRSNNKNFPLDSCNGKKSAKLKPE